MTVFNKGDSYLSLFITAHAQNKQFLQSKMASKGKIYQTVFRRYMLTMKNSLRDYPHLLTSPNFRLLVLKCASSYSRVFTILHDFYTASKLLREGLSQRSNLHPPLISFACLLSPLQQFQTNQYLSSPL